MYSYEYYTYALLLFKRLARRRRRKFVVFGSFLNPENCLAEAKVLQISPKFSGPTGPDFLLKKTENAQNELKKTGF